MKTLLNKTASTLSGAVLFCIGGLMAGIGLTVIVLLAMFGLAAAGLAILAAPFVASARPDWLQEERAEAAASA